MSSRREPLRFAPSLRSQDQRGAADWSAWVDHALTATGARPNAKWLAAARACLGRLDADRAVTVLADWFHRVVAETGAGELWDQGHADGLRGLLWMTPLLPPDSALTRAIAVVAQASFRKIPGLGPRSIKVGNAAFYALSEFASPDAVAQLVVLKGRIKQPAAQRELHKALERLSKALGVEREEIEELGVPTYGLQADGQLTETLGDYTARIVVTGADADLRWTDARGKSLKSVPARVRSEHAEELQELQQTLKDIRAMLPAQRDRLDGMCLAQRSWAISVWRERYLEQPLIGTIAARLLWCVDGTPALFVDGRPTDAAGRSIPHGRTAEITLWHPVGRTVGEIVDWRRRLETLAITQPFKQAHREVYLLTDAERRTGTYSNRFAAHVVRQHQFHALCAARGWRNRLRLMVDDAYEPPCKLLPQWGLRAEFWVEGLGDDVGADTNESGVFLRLSTDQVRFYRTGAAPNFAHAAGGGYTTCAPAAGTDGVNAPLPLEQVPPLVFSEIMRDVDLFVGVASIGNDPTWHDGGPQGRFLDYWQKFSFGDLSGTAATRKQALERLIPRLRIADRCSFSDRFLIVRGSLRTYRIHLGSGNILMEPNDQYLCIVPDARTRSAQQDVSLPFEGDSMLSIILSKALLLAEDAKIKDATITRQIALR